MSQQPWQQPPGAPAQPQQQHAQQQPVGTAQQQAPTAIPSLSGAQVGNQQGRPLPSGYDYVVEIVQVLVKNTYYGLRFIVEFTVAESTNPAVRPGDAYSWSRPFDDQYGHGPNEIKGWICMLIEKLVPDSSPGTQWDDGYTAYVAGEQQPARGVAWLCKVWDKPKRNPSPGTSPVIAIVDWSIWDGQHLPVGPQPQAAAPAAPPAAPALPPAPAGAPPAGPPAAPAGAPPGWPAGLPFPPQGSGQ
jgi:hypothetical protein